MATKNDPKALLNFIKNLGDRQVAAPQQALLDRIQKNLEEKQQMELQTRIEKAMSYIEFGVQQLRDLRKKENTIKNQIEKVNKIVEKILAGEDLTEDEQNMGI